MVEQGIERKRCVSCNRWQGARRPLSSGEGVEFDPENDRGKCYEGPWHDTLRSSRSACGQWLLWKVLVEIQQTSAAGSLLQPADEGGDRR